MNPHVSEGSERNGTTKGPIRPKIQGSAFNGYSNGCGWIIANGENARKRIGVPLVLIPLNREIAGSHICSRGRRDGQIRRGVA